MPYDLILDINGALIKIQVKSAWFCKKTQNYVVDNRRTKTNRRKMIRENYIESDFDFALVYIEDLDVCYIFPSAVFISYGGAISLVEAEKRQRKPRSANYRESWDMIEEWASYRETDMRQSLKFGETLSNGNSEPSSQMR